MTSPPTNQLPYLTFASLASTKVGHGIFSRWGGVSPPPFDSLNINYHVGDPEENVRHNRALIRKTLDIVHLVSAQQVHGDTIHRITEIPRKAEIESEGADSLISDVKGIFLMIQQADCQAVMIFDPTHLAVANVHTGWRGSVANIIGKTIQAMMDAYLSRPADLLAVISPSLGKCCAEFVNYRQELPKSFEDYRVSEHFFDFPAISRDQLITAGLKPSRIETAGICTRCDPSWFSYRRDKITGRFCSVIGLR